MCSSDLLLTNLLAELRTDLMRPAAELLLADVSRARAGLERLRGAWTTPGWERRKVIDFRGSRQQDFEVTGVGADGPLIQVDGAPSTLGWEPFMGSLRGMSYLFNKRVAGGWPSAAGPELDSLVRLATLLEGLAGARTMLADGKPSERRIEAMTAPFLALAEGEELLLDRSAAAREREAALALAEALRARLAGDVVHEALHLERLLIDHGESALVLLLRGPE